MQLYGDYFINLNREIRIPFLNKQFLMESKGVFLFVAQSCVPQHGNRCPLPGYPKRERLTRSYYYSWWWWFSTEVRPYFLLERVLLGDSSEVAQRFLLWAGGTNGYSKSVRRLLCVAEAKATSQRSISPLIPGYLRSQVFRADIYVVSSSDEKLAWLPMAYSSVAPHPLKVGQPSPFL